jgi:hypothetical protein
VKAGTLQDDSDDERGYLVDFEKKSWEDDQLETNPSKVSMFSADMDMEERRRNWEREQQKGNDKYDIMILHFNQKWRRSLNLKEKEMKEGN